MAEFAALAERIATLVPSSATVLEVAPGPGFLAIELAKRGFDVTGVDISRTFVEIAQRNAAAAGVMPRFELGDAAALPIADASVDFVICRAAFKNFSRPVPALAEMRRVLRKGGTALLIDMRRDVSMNGNQALYRRAGSRLAKPLAYDLNVSHGSDQTRLCAGPNPPNGERSRVGRAANRDHAPGI